MNDSDIEQYVSDALDDPNFPYVNGEQGVFFSVLTNLLENSDLESIEEILEDYSTQIARDIRDRLGDRAKNVQFLLSTSDGMADYL